MSEAALEEYFRRSVVHKLKGHPIKLAPTQAGLPDRLVLLPGGAAFLVELKTETGKLSPIQIEWHNRAERLGTTVYTLYGKGEIDRWVTALHPHIRR